MIATIEGAEILRFLEDVRRRPEQYSEFVICSPFVDVELSRFVAELATHAHRARCAFRLITRPAAATMLLSALPGPNARWTKMLFAHPHLHAKAYLGLGRGSRSQAIVTSANLTVAGLKSNIELGVRADSTSVAGRQLVDQVRRFLRQMAPREAGLYNPNP